jgi:hypothetical protein
MNKSFGYNESKKLSPEAQKQRGLFLEKQNITSPLAMFRIRSRIILVSRIRIRRTVNIWILIQIRIKVKRGMQIGSTSRRH